MYEFSLSFTNNSEFPYNSSLLWIEIFPGCFDINDDLRNAIYKHNATYSFMISTPEEKRRGYITSGLKIIFKNSKDAVHFKLMDYWTIL